MGSLTSLQLLEFSSISKFTSTCYIAQKMKFSIQDFFSKYDQITFTGEIPFMENFIFCAVLNLYFELHNKPLPIKLGDGLLFFKFGQKGVHVKIAQK